MADPIDTPRRSSWLWIAVIAVLAVLLVIWLLDPSGDADDDLATAETPAATDGFIAVPEDEAAVPVDLPEATLAAPTETPEAAVPATPTP